MQIDIIKLAEIIGAFSVILGVIIGLLSLVGTILGTVGGIIAANKLTTYRIKVLIIELTTLKSKRGLYD